MSEQEHPPFAASSDTSAEAAEMIKPNAEKLRQAVYLHVVAAGIDGATCDETEVSLDLAHQTCSPRFWELHKKGVIFDSGLRRKTRSGRRAAVYVSKREWIKDVSPRSAS